MNRLKILLIASALIAGSSVVASAEENHQNGIAVQVRVGDGAYVGVSDDHYRYIYQNDRWRDRDDRFRHDRDDRRGRDWDHDGDRR